MSLFLSNIRSKWIEEFGKGAHLFFYMADEGANALNLSRENLNILEDSLLASGSHADTGDWQLHLKSMVMLSWKWCMVEYYFLCNSYCIVWRLWLINHVFIKEECMISVNSFLETVGEYHKPTNLHKICNMPLCSILIT